MTSALPVVAGEYLTTSAAPLGRSAEGNRDRDGGVVVAIVSAGGSGPRRMLSARASSPRCVSVRRTSPLCPYPGCATRVY